MLVGLDGAEFHHGGMCQPVFPGSTGAGFASNGTYNRCRSYGAGAYVFHTKNSYSPLTMALMPGDEIEISFLGAPDLGITQRIRRDGRISLRLVGEMMAGGKTPAEVRAELIDLYGSQIQFKEVTVKVLTSPPVFVLGAVLKAGPRGYEPTLERLGCDC